MTEVTEPPLVDSWTAPDGVTFGRMRWLPPGGMRGRVIALHGLGCWAEDFLPLGVALRARGLSLEAWHLRGQGLDPEITRRGAWLQVEGLLADLEAYADLADETPTFLCGDSMGALLTIQAAVREPWRSRLRGVILLVPVVALAQDNPPWLQSALRLAVKIAPRLRLRPGWFVHGKGGVPPLSRIPERQRALEVAPHRLGPLTLGFLASMGGLIEAAGPAAPRLNLPVALVSAGHDVFIRPEQTRAFFEHVASTDKTLLHYPESYHQVLFDLDAPRVVADVTAWIEARV